MQELLNERPPADTVPRGDEERAIAPALWRDYGDPELHVIDSASVKRLPPALAAALGLRR